ncbi:cytochrome-c oxidase, cbb3-type subunit I [soil metagenome]
MNTIESASDEEGVGELKKETIVYDDVVVQKFIIASLLFGVIGMLVGAVCALQLAFWQANVHPMLSFGRLRPLHTNAVIFAFVGNMMFAGIYYSTQRLLKARLASDVLTKIHFWGWQAIIVAAAITLPMGMTQAKEYAELEWPIDVAIAIVWVVFAVNFFWTIAKRREKHLSVAIWFSIATIITVAVLHIVNNLSIPIFGGGFKSYSIYGGAKDALVQWWYGHNAVAFFLTTPILGIMYYFVPKAVSRPVYSYRLSIVHFWALIFLYIWAGPHHLLNSALPEWAQTLGVIFSVMLWAPSWGGMINGLLTLRGAWDKLRTDPVVKFYAAAVTFYGMATFEGPLLSFRSVNGLAHYTDWIIGHVHAGALGWNGFMAAGMFYWLVPRLWGKKELHSKALAEYHFYLATFGILLYVIAMWVSGVTQGLMWRELTADGSLRYSFLETLEKIRLMYWMRLIGGSMYLIGFLMMVYNLGMTMRGGHAVKVEKVVVVPAKALNEPSWASIVFSGPVILVVIVASLLGTVAVVNAASSAFFAVIAATVAVFGAVVLQLSKRDGKPSWHRVLEGRALLFTVFALVAVLVGGVAELIPVVVIQTPVAHVGQQPYRPLELEGRDVYIREGCFNCHSQMIRALSFESKRYGRTPGDVSLLSDSQYDHPFLWGSKRTGPDLAREGGLRGDVWHYKHFVDPRSISDGSNMPPYAHFLTGRVDLDHTADKLRAMQMLGVPYTQADIDRAPADAREQGDAIAKSLAADGVRVDPGSDMVAIIAYVQSIGVIHETKKDPARVAAEP